MKILQFINSLTAGGAEKLLVDATIGYHKRGIDIDILLLKDSDSPFKKELEKYPEIKIFSLTKNKSVYNPLLLFELNAYFKRYDIVHVHLFPALYWASISKSLHNNGTKLILTEHSTNNKRRNSKLFRYVDRLIYRKFDAIVSISKIANVKLKKHLGDSFSNIQFINNGVDIRIFQNAEPYQRDNFGLSNRDNIIIQVSSFRYPKDQKTIIKTLSKLKDNTHLFLVGEGPLKQENVDYAKTLDILHRVHFLGVRDDVPRLLKSSDIIVLSSHYEGLSLSSVEGLASGKPFISTNVPGLTEVVENAGLLFEYQDFENLVKIIEKLQNDTEYYDRIANRGALRANEYNFEGMIESYIEVYNKILNKT